MGLCQPFHTSKTHLTRLLRFFPLWFAVSAGEVPAFSACLTMIGEIQADAGRLAAEAVSVWLAFWAIRRKYDLDYRLDRTAQILRWVIIAAAVGLGRLGAQKFEPLRIFSAFLFLSFLAWPNFAYHLTRILRRWKLIPAPSDRDELNQQPR